MKTTRLKVTGMSCRGCAASVGKALLKVPGISAKATSTMKRLSALGIFGAALTGATLGCTSRMPPETLARAGLGGTAIR